MTYVDTREKFITWIETDQKYLGTLSWVIFFLAKRVLELYPRGAAKDGTDN